VGAKLVTGDKIYCICNAPHEQIIREHAKQGGFPADSIAEVNAIIDPPLRKPKESRCEGSNGLKAAESITINRLFPPVLSPAPNMPPEIRRTTTRPLHLLDWEIQRDVGNGGRSTFV
jgi:Nickel responsive protein SCO4226-like